MSKQKIFQVFLLSLASAGALVLSACDYKFDPPSDFGEKEMQKHYQNGEMNGFQYENNVGVFVPPGASKEPPAATASATGTNAPASGTATPPNGTSTPASTDSTTK